MRFGEKKIVKEKFYAAKIPIKIVRDNIVVLKLCETKTNSMHFIRIKRDKAIRPSVLIMPKMIWYIKTLEIEDKISKLTSSRVDDEKLLEKNKAIWTKIEDLRNIELDAS